MVNPARVLPPTSRFRCLSRKKNRVHFWNRCNRFFYGVVSVLFLFRSLNDADDIFSSFTLFSSLFWCFMRTLHCQVALSVPCMEGAVKKSRCLIDCWCGGWFGAAVTALVTSTKSKRRRARLVLGLVTTFGRSTILAHAVSVGRCIGYWLPPMLGKKRRVLRNSGTCYQDCWHSGWLNASSIGSNSSRLKG